MSKVKDKITVYIVAESDYVNSLAKEYIAKYTDLNSNVSYSTVDPAVKPGFVSQYTDETLSSQQTNLILVNQTNGRSRVITYDEIFPVQYSEEALYNYYYYGVTPTGTTYFNIEQSLTSAIDYLTTENLPVVYYEMCIRDSVPSEVLSEETSDAGRSSFTIISSAFSPYFFFIR